MAKRFRWTRAAYRHAHHLSRLLQRLDYCAEKPEIVDRYHRLWDQHYMPRDPLQTPIRYRLDIFKDDIPF